MKASCLWLRELVPAIDPALTPRDIAARLTSVGLEVEGFTEYGAGAESCVVVQVTGVRPHPTKSGLRLVTVTRGQGSSQEVVCGAPNVPEPGGLVVLAPLGVHLPAKDLTIAPRAIGGVTSEGMLCSESELGLSDEHDGIIVLPPGTAEPGTPLSVAIPNARDTILEIVGVHRVAELEHHEVRDVDDVRDRSDAEGLEAIPEPRRRRADRDVERCPHFGAASWRARPT